MIPILFVSDRPSPALEAIISSLDRARFDPSLEVPSAHGRVARLVRLARARGVRLIATEGAGADLAGPRAAALVGAAAVSLRPGAVSRPASARLVAAVVVESEAEREALARAGYPADRIHVIALRPESAGQIEELFDQALAEIGAGGGSSRAIRRAAKTAIATAYRAVRPLLPSARGGRICLCYHRVLPVLGATDPWLVVGVDTFRRQLEAIGRTYEFVTARDLAREDLRGGKGRPLCAITFDDGFADNLEHGLPVLRAIGAPATVFVSTDAVSGHGALWFERVGSAVSAAMRRGARADLLAAVRALLDLTLDGFSDAVTVTRAVCAALKDLPTAERQGRIEALESQIGAAPPAELPRYLSWDDVGELDRAGWEIGSHTMTHPILPRTADARAREEIVGSREQIAQRIGRPPAGFAYPNGDCDDRIVAMVRDAGYEYAVVALPEQARPSDPYRISRRCVSTPTSRGWAAGFSEGAFVAEIEGVLDRLR
ncbi:MAG: polysaccharide deacetylase family protein [Deltaproteobacteria bacterium]|nr:polysaccharide deacetylase family protein [Deltaproteobacteria bacterium]